MKLLLSICIPTYNRCNALRRVFDGLRSDVYFQRGEDFEIVVSDNASTDDTQEICESFACEFPNQFVYHRRQVNGGTEVNELTLLNLARGEYIKFQNDCYSFLPGGLQRLVEFVKKHVKDRPLLCFGNGAVSGLEERVYPAKSYDEFLQLFSYWTTWIGGYGLWREDVQKILTVHEKYVSTLLPQVAVIWVMFELHGKALINNECYFGESYLAGKKGGYNFAKVFGLNYLSLLRLYCGEGRISEDAYKREKKRLYINQIFPMYFDFLGKYAYQRGGFWKYTVDYHREWYYWLSFPMWMGFKAVAILPLSVRSLLVDFRRWIKQS